MMNETQNILEEFEWPRKSDLERIMTTESIRIKTIELWQNTDTVMDASLHSIRITLSNGESSKIFGPSCKKFKKRKIHLDENIQEVNIKCSV